MAEKTRQRGSERKESWFYRPAGDPQGTRWEIEWGLWNGQDNVAVLGWYRTQEKGGLGCAGPLDLASLLRNAFVVLHLRMPKTQEERKAAARESQLKYRIANKGKTIARAAVRYAISTGKLVIQPCEGCQSAKAEAHHDNYSKPLEFRWLCKRCHGEWHYQLRMDGHYVKLADGTPSKIELPGFAKAPEGYEIEGYIPSADGWTTRVRRIVTPEPPKRLKTLVKRKKSATKA